MRTPSCFFYSLVRGFVTQTASFLFSLMTNKSAELLIIWLISRAFFFKQSLPSTFPVLKKGQQVHTEVTYAKSPVFLPGESHGQMSLAVDSPRGHKELDMAEQLTLCSLYAKPHRSKLKLHTQLWFQPL